MTDTLVRDDLDDLTIDVDPRFAQRRADVEEERRQRRNGWWFCGAAGIVFTAVVAVIALRSTFFEVHTVRVSGAVHVRVSDVRDAAAIAIDSSMFDVDGAGAVRRIERLPWVEHVSVRRQWPSTVSIEIREYDASASITVGHGRTRLVSPDGRVVAEVATSDVPPGVLPIVGVRHAPALGDTIYPPVVGQLGLVVPRGLREQLASIDISGADVVLRLRSGMTVSLGTAEDVRHELAAAEAMLASGQLRACTRHLDVSVPSNPVARC